MKKWLMALLMMLLCMQAALAAETAYIDGGTADRVHLRQSPAETAASLGLYFTGTPVERLADLAGGWSRVRVGSETGFIRTQYLAGTGHRLFPSYVVDNRTSDWVNLRSGASFDKEPVGRLNNGDAVLLMGETASGWSYVEADGLRGYVVTEFLRATGQSAPAAASPSVAMKTLGTTPDGQFILSCTPANGQTIYLVAQEEQPLCDQLDVNFDGYPDLVVTTIRGTTNCFCEFFIWQGGGYVRAAHPGVDEGIANYQLYPEEGWVLSSANNGNAGALFDECLYRWDGTDLQLVRRATAESLREYRSEGATFVTVFHDRKISLTVYDCTGEDSVLIHSETVSMDDMNADKLERMKQHLWTGLR